MAQSSGKKVILMILVVFLLLMVTMAAQHTRKLAKRAPTAQCNIVTDAEKGDSCASIAKIFNLELKFFLQINPNIDCNNIFIGQWLCIDGLIS